ncbi:MAG: carboxylating nicotinate-nucleotide diphosphorylase [Phycisphaera sp.]|nr:carboxylating nicotinate-nucleotide diphosphorylase [Phycisphaera sp.]
MPLSELFETLIDEHQLDTLIATARREDVDDAGDVTSSVFVPAHLEGSAVVRARREGRLAGTPLLANVASAYDPRLRVDVSSFDGARLEPGADIAVISGPLAGILTAERVMLNFLTHLSGIATLTHRYVEAVDGTAARIYDTRKTIPGLRHLAKYAVRCGGGYCHRIGLYDAVLVKDNHIAHVPPKDLHDHLATKIAAARARKPAPSFIEVEVDTLDQFRKVVTLDVDIVLLDNMTPDQLREAVAVRNDAAPKVKLEASGGVDLDSVRAIAEAGVDRIAIGALTHSAPALDIGLDIDA